MKKMWLLIVGLMICVCGYCQSHMKFQGIEINGTKKDFVDQLVKKGYKYITTNQSGAYLTGTFTNKKVDVMVTTNSLGNVVAVGLVLPESDEWKSLLNEYNYYKDLYSQKYGRPTSVNEKYDYKTNDNYLNMLHIVDGKTEWECWFGTPEGEILLSIEGNKRQKYGDRTANIIIMYRDKENMKNERNKDFDDI